MNTTLKTLTLAVCGPLVFSTGLAQADVLFYQGFEYGGTATGLTAVAATDWTRIAGSVNRDVSYQPTGLSKKGSLSNGGSVKTPSVWTDPAVTLKQDLNLSLAGKNGFWISLLVSSDSATPPANSLASVSLFVLENNWQAAVQYRVSKAWNSTAGFAFHRADTGGIMTGAEFSTIGTDTIRVVISVRKSTRPEIWINPTTPPVIGTGQVLGNSTAGNLTAIESLQISFQGVAINFDEIVIGDTYADVTAAHPTLISIR